MQDANQRVNFLASWKFEKDVFSVRPRFSGRKSMTFEFHHEVDLAARGTFEKQGAKRLGSPANIAFAIPRVHGLSP